jgi:N-acyl-D-amino-acid deacylase
MGPAKRPSRATWRSWAGGSPRSAATGPARREIDAAGLLVTPGWVDVHTHYDGQAMWDPLLAPSCWHGVTTTMFGNCGVGFAPVKPHHRAALMDLMEGVEEIPGVVLAEGLTLEWESFSDFLDALDRRPHVIDVAAPKRMSFSASVPHSAPWAPAPSA